MIKIYFVPLILCALSFQAVFAGSMKASFKIESHSFHNNQTIAEKFVYKGMGCSGLNISPHVSWSGEPSGTKYFAVTMFDPDAPTGSGWWHWTVFNIPVSVHELAEGSSASAKIPAGAVEGLVDYGQVGYGGPCPPVGSKAHHYILTVYALKDRIPLEKNDMPAKVGFYINSLMLTKAHIIAVYGR